jgi:uracil-DNA glycosylase
VHPTPVPPWPSCSPEASPRLFGPSNALVEPLVDQFQRVPECWRPLTDAFAQSSTGQALIQRVDARREAGATIYPADVFAALHATPQDQVRVVILGQDPYHGPDQAHGLAFSVLPGQKVPPSLRNIHKEIARSQGHAASVGACLTPWAEQGVLLLNTGLTVEDGQAASHAGWGWEALTDALIASLAAQGGDKVFLLWGAHAQRKEPLIQAAGRAGHLVLKSNHPSPLSATRGPVPFIGCGHFEQAARFWAERGHALHW